MKLKIRENKAERPEPELALWLETCEGGAVHLCSSLSTGEDRHEFYILPDGFWGKIHGGNLKNEGE